MAAATSRHRYGTKLRHCHPMYFCRRRDTARSVCLASTPVNTAKTDEQIEMPFVGGGQIREGPGNQALDESAHWRHLVI